MRISPGGSGFTFDSTGHTTSTTAPAPSGQSGYETSTFAYDPAGLPVTETDPAASNGANAPAVVTHDTYNADGQLVAETTGYGTATASTVSYCYDPNGNVTSVVAPDGNVSGTALCNTSPSHPGIVDPTAYPTQAAFQTTTTYDSAGNEISTTTPATAAAPNGATTSFTYDSAGRPATSTDPNGITTTDSYTNDELTGISYSGNSAPAVSYSYDAAGNLTQMSDGTGSSSYSYDPFGELTSVTNGAGKTTTYGYDANGNVTSIGYPLPTSATWATSNTVTYGYDHADQLTSVGDFNGHQTSITYTPNGLQSAVSLGSTGDTINTTYDQNDNPSAITLKNSSSTLLGFSYQDGPLGDIISETDTPNSAQSPAYAYDAQGRITSMTVGNGGPANYGFDASGNLATLPNGASAITSTTNGYDNAGELTAATLSSTTTNYTYDRDGNRLTAKQGTTLVASGTWNGAGRLTSFSDPAAAMTAAAYDGSGLRQSATFGGTTQNFTWSGDTLLMDSQNAYVYASDTAPLEQVNLSTGAVSYLATDALGSVRGLVSSTGSLTASTSYDAWGNPQTPAGLTAYTPFGYAGSYTDPTGMLYLINRYYDPATGQFLSVDPLADESGEPYGYAAGNPVSNSDPQGLLAWMAGWVWFEEPETSEFDFQQTLRALMGWPRLATSEYAITWKSNPNGYRDRRIDIYQKAPGWFNELKVGRQTMPITPLNVTSNYSEVHRDRYLLDKGPHIPKSVAVHGSTRIWAHGDTWWFRYHTGSACQMSASGNSKCPNDALINELMFGGNNGINVMLLVRANRRQKKLERIYSKTRRTWRQAVESYACPYDVQDDLHIGVWKFPDAGSGPPGVNANTCAGISSTP